MGNDFSREVFAVSGKIALFFASLFFSLSSPGSGRRQKLFSFLEELCPEVPEPSCCQELLEIWSEEYGFAGLLLGNLGLFLLGLVLMVALELLLHRFSQPVAAGALSTLGALYCLWKFRTPDLQKNLLTVLFIGFWLISGFSWPLAFAFLILYTNLTARYKRRND